jgi:hypothetical protein
MRLKIHTDWFYVLQDSNQCSLSQSRENCGCVLSLMQMTSCRTWRRLPAAFLLVNVARDGQPVTFCDRQAILRSAQQTGLQRHGLDRDDLDRHKAIWQYQTEEN